MICIHVHFVQKKKTEVKYNKIVRSFICVQGVRNAHSGNDQKIVHVHYKKAVYKIITSHH